LALGIAKIRWLGSFLLHPLTTAFGFVLLTPSGIGFQEGAIVGIFLLLGVDIRLALTFAIPSRGLLLIEDLRYRCTSDCKIDSTSTLRYDEADQPQWPTTLSDQHDMRTAGLPHCGVIYTGRLVRESHPAHFLIPLNTVADEMLQNSSGPASLQSCRKSGKHSWSWHFFQAHDHQAPQRVCAGEFRKS
jgi:hypothetical protein